MINSNLGMNTNVSHRVIKNNFNAPLSWKIKNLPNLVKGEFKKTIGEIFNIPTHFATLHLVVNTFDGKRIDYGKVSTRVITTEAVNFMASAFADSGANDIGNFNFHALGTGSTAAATGDGALGNEPNNLYRVGGSASNNRASGTQSSATNVYTTVGTNTINLASSAITEHGIFNAQTGDVVLLDRSVFSVINLSAGDSLETTYTLTLTAGG